MKNKKVYIITGVSVVVLAVVFYFVLRKDLSGNIIIPYISHQKPAVDPHLPNANPIADKLDEVQFDGLFNISANASGIVYEDGLGELLGIDENNVVSIRLKKNVKWHNSFNAKLEDNEVKITEGNAVYFSAEDLLFTLRRIQNLGSLSPDYILVSQAMTDINFTGPDADNVIKFQFKSDRIWTEPDIKEVLSFKILPKNSDLNALNYNVGTSNYLQISNPNNEPMFYKSPIGVAEIPFVKLAPFVDNSTFATELNNTNINVLLDTPFGSLNSILSDKEDYFYKSSISTTFFAILYNTQKLNVNQRQAAKSLFNNRRIIDRFFKIGTEQQRNIVDYKGNKNNYYDYLNYSVFPHSSYYYEEKIVMPKEVNYEANLSVLPDTLRIVACVNYGYREEYSELIDILNDPKITKGKVKVKAVQNEDIKKGNYDAVLVAFTGYRSNFLFDLFDVFFREPNLETYRINLKTKVMEQGQLGLDYLSLREDNNFCRINLSSSSAESEALKQFADYVYGFMSTREIGDKQAYAERIDALENDLALGSWLFSVPSLSYFSTQFDAKSINLFGVASQLSTIENWKEKKKK
ncbi:MAG TPA: hypothetical protein PL041_06975 [Melioribacteraceae bacterium]|nr:hypothetical protein [Melioribacteraceae bacterium]